MKRAEVFWRDAFHVFDADEKLSEVHEDFVVRTLGYVVDDNDRFLVIAQEVLPEGRGYRSVSAIPKSLVLQVKVLSEINRR